jgi:flagellar biosynthetic protein FliQ
MDRLEHNIGSASPGEQPGRHTHGRVWFMTVDHATELIRHTLIMALIVSAPMLIIGLVVGVVVSLLQAVTQIQEQTLTFIPKIAAMFAAAILLLPWIGHRLIEYTSSMILSGQLP